MTASQIPLQNLKNKFQMHRDDLNRLVRIPSVSFPGFDHKHVSDSAEMTASILKRSGLENLQIFTSGKSLPYVYADWLHAGPDKPTVLLYAHHDVQPFGREDLWLSAPFEPTLRDGPGGMRLYGRGTADDKAGIIIHTSAIDAYLSSGRPLPVNVKVLIEGEEEIGSPYLAQCLKEQHALIKSDIMILTDTANYDCGVPSLTISLRGMAVFEVEVRALKGSIHSGFWGGVVPDPAMALTKMLSGIVDDHGKITIQEILDLVPKLSADEERIYENLPFNDHKFAEQSGMVSGSHLHKHLNHPMKQIWHYPSATINAIQSSSRAQAGNTINDTAWARVSFRLPPGMDPAPVIKAFENHMQKMTPWGLNVSVIHHPPGQGWSINPYGKHRHVFDLAMLSLEEGYGAKPVYAGCGATIPFVKPFSSALGDAPALLVGIEDPYTNAHGENESLLVSDFEKACLSQAILLAKLGQI